MCHCAEQPKWENLSIKQFTYPFRKTKPLKKAYLYLNLQQAFSTAITPKYGVLKNSHVVLSQIYMQHKNTCAILWEGVLSVQLSYVQNGIPTGQAATHHHPGPF